MMNIQHWTTEINNYM